MDNDATIKTNSAKVSTYYRSEGGNKPSGAAASSKKDFKKVYDNKSQGKQTADDDRINKNDEDEVVVFNSQKIPTAPANPFTLVASNDKPVPQKMDEDVLPEDQSQDKDVTAIEALSMTDPNAKPAPQSTVPDSKPPVFTLVSANPEPDLDVNNTAKLTKPDQNVAQVDYWTEKTKEISTQKTETSKQEMSQQFGKEQPDLAYINSLQTQALPQTAPTASVDTPRPVIATNMQALIDQLAKEMTVVQTGDQTETSIVLKNQFDGVRVTITTQDSATNQLNIKFENLTQAAQQLLDNQQNRADLLSNLERRGYFVQMIVTTTFEETKPLIITANADTPNRERDPQQEKEDRREQQRRQR